MVSFIFVYGMLVNLYIFFFIIMNNRCDLFYVWLMWVFNDLNGYVFVGFKYIKWMLD